MPTDLVTVDRVIVTPTKIPDVTRYDIGVHIVGANLGIAFQTTNPWTASACERAVETGKKIYLFWHESKYGRTIDAIEFA